MDLTTPIANGGPLSNDDFRIRYPEKDFDGYWLVGGIRGDDRFQAMFLGFGLGVNAGYDWGFKHVVPDTNFSLYVIRLIAADDTVTYVEQPIHRHQFRYDHSKFDVQLEDRVRIRGEWPHVEYYMASPDKSVIVELEGKMSIAHWSPDLVFRETSWITVAMPDLEMQGVITVDGVEQPFSGIATLDHPSGRLFTSPTSPGMGWWEYNATMLNEQCALLQYKIVDGDGKDTWSEAVTTFPDGKYHTGKLEFEYTRWDESGEVPVPREWRSVVHADHGTLELVTRAVGQEGGEPQRRGEPLPNFLLLQEGEFRGKDGRVEQFTGKGTGESVMSERDPFKHERQKPW